MKRSAFSAKDHVETTTLGLEIAVAEVLCGYGGYLLDKKWGTLPWCLLVGAFLGFCLGMYRIWQEIKKAQKRKK
ncbi:MAG: AtpZ/AtpI family protein [Elusimicrobiaceae bacterium]|nr:AtpZ/AtpI family protein [Elusimicrobiaceae bacterium]